MYFEHNIHDNLCVVHSLNNILQNFSHIPRITSQKLMKWSKDNSSKYYDKTGFDLFKVLHNLKLHYGITFKNIKPFKNLNSYARGYYLISVHKHDYNHMVSIVNGVLMDNEDKDEKPYTEIKYYKILDLHKLMI